MARLWIVTGCLVLLLMSVSPVLAEQQDTAQKASESDETAVEDSSSTGGMVSLAEEAPELYYQLRRYPKFYGDPNTINGRMLDRSYLFGDLGGVRDDLVDYGIYFDASVTQFLQSNVSGGQEDDRTRNNGTSDYWVTLDTGKAGLWSGGAIFAHAESSWQAERSINGDVGGLVPPNFDATMPTPGDSEAIVLPELYMVQALSSKFLVLAGKANWGGVADNNVFANNERTQFSYTGLVNNPILGAFIPYTSLGMGGVWTPSKEHTVAVVGVQSKGKATTTGFDDFNGEYTGGGQYQYSPTIGGNLPGNYRAIAGYTNKDVAAFDIDRRQLIEQILGIVPVAEKSDNYAFLVNFDQYLWVKDEQPLPRRKHLPPNGIGVFGRAGWAPDDRNVIDQFYSAGIGGYGMLLPGRDYDNWGVGWAGTHLSSDLRAAAQALNVELDDFENALEAFYNFELTPATHLTLNAQAVDSTAKTYDTAYAVGLRLQIDF